MSCVVKWCKNRSDRKKKNPGITFHRFPKENEVWRSDWIQIIRNCNGENEWIPNKYSVICSLHFEGNDLYTTKGGLRRVVTYAVPQKFLFEPAHMTEKQPAAVPYVPSASQQSTSVIVPALEHPGSSSMIVKQEYLPAEPNISDVLRESTSVTVPAFEHPGSSTMFLKQEYLPAEPTISNALREGSSVTVPALEHPGSSTMILKQEYLPAELTIFNALRESSSVTVPALEHPGSSTVILKQEYLPAELTISNALRESTSVTVPALEHPGSSTIILKREYLPAEKNISNALRESTSLTVPALENPGSSTMIVKREYLPAEPNISNALRESTSVTVPALEHPGSSIMILKREYLPAEQNISNPLRESISVIETKALEQPDTSTLVCREEQQIAAEPNISSTIQENSPEIGADEEQLLSILNTPKKRHLKQCLIKKQDIINKQKREIKTLKQKVKRLQNRNKSIKKILKSLKKNNYVNTETFNRLKENMVTVDLFNNLNRKTLKKKIKYTPAIIKFCLTLNYYAPKAYDYVRQTFDLCLPHRKTLSKRYGHIKGDPGFTEESFQAFKANALVSQHPPLCSLTFDSKTLNN